MILFLAKGMIHACIYLDYVRVPARHYSMGEGKEGVAEFL
jgi:hypothetical protein